MTVGLALAGLALLAAPIVAAAQTTGALSDEDARFVNKAAADGLAEIDIARIAQQRAASDAVRQYAARLAQDHSTANEELRAIVQRKGHAMPHDVDHAHAGLRDRLMNLGGQEFDRMYMNEMVRDHQQAVSEFERHARTGTDPDIKAFAAKNVPVLQEHLRAAQDITTRLALGPSGPQPAASVVTTTTVTTTPAAPAAWCAGAWRPEAGTNFGPCPK
jgi:putative membrane protein